MADTSSRPDMTAYRLRVVIAGISPLIWRRLLIPATTTIAQLHAILQASFGWSGEHLLRFVIGGLPLSDDDEVVHRAAPRR